MSLTQFNEITADERLVEMSTSMGDIQIKLFPKQAPKAVENFVTHAKNGYYEGVVFHRVIKDFMIQGGDPEGTGMGGESIWGDSFEDEFSPDLFHFNGALSMANAGPHSNGSQFFIVHKSDSPATREQFEKVNYPKEAIDKYLEVGGTAHLDGRHTVFGQVVKGMDIVNNIAAVKTGSQDRPAEEIKILKIEVLK